MKKKILTVKSSITTADLKSNIEYQEDLQENKFFDEIEKIDHSIEVPKEYRERLKGHVCMCGKLIFSSFLPNEIQKEYNEYTRQKTVNEVLDKNTQSLAEQINKRILSQLKK